jgi:hypothetical protein
VPPEITGLHEHHAQVKQTRQTRPNNDEPGISRPKLVMRVAMEETVQGNMRQAKYIKRYADNRLEDAAAGKPREDEKHERDMRGGEDEVTGLFFQAGKQREDRPFPAADGVHFMDDEKGIGGEEKDIGQQGLI